MNDVIFARIFIFLLLSLVHKVWVLALEGAVGYIFYEDLFGGGIFERRWK